MIDQLRAVIGTVLPDGCPFVIGGGLIRDAIYGGRPGDIDVWLPSNIHVPDVDHFCSLLARNGYGQLEGFQGQVIFRGPGANVQEVTEGVFGGFGDAEFNTENYGDVHNHWVVEIQQSPNAPAGSVAFNGHPRVNFMRNMARWTGDAPSFFTEIMRNFDLDICMFFIGYMPGQNSLNTVIMPQHLRIAMAESNRTRRAVPPRMNEVYWNQARLQNTALPRIQARVDKMNDKYNLRLSRDIEQLRMIPTSEIIAEPVALSSIMQYFNHDMGWGCMQTPTRQNTVHQEVFDRAWAEATQLFQDWRGRMAMQGVVNTQVTPHAFLRLPA